MDFSNICKKLKGNYWLLIGVLAFLSTSISSIIRTIPEILSPTLWDILYTCIDWFAACILYFFIGALIGHFIDWIMAKKSKKKIIHPLWFYMTAGFWILNIVVIAIIKPENLSWVMVIIFPLAYSIFFNGMAFVMLAPKSIETSYYGKAIFDIIMIALFWLYLKYTLSKKNNIARIFLIIIFLILILGFAGCAITMAK